jgi:hypothetical protein
MRFALLLLSVAPVWAQITGPATASVAASSLHGKYRIALGTLTELEKRFDVKLGTLGGVNDPVDMLGSTRGIYLDGYGAVFTTEVSLLMVQGITPFHKVITDQERAQVHQKKIERLPKLKQAMREFLKTAAQTLFNVPEDQQIVVAVRLDYMKWEDTLGLPGLVIVKADRKAAFVDNIQVEEQ